MKNILISLIVYACTYCPTFAQVEPASVEVSNESYAEIIPGTLKFSPDLIRPGETTYKFSKNTSDGKTIAGFFARKVVMDYNSGTLICTQILFADKDTATDTLIVELSSFVPVYHSIKNKDYSLHVSYNGNLVTGEAVSTKGGTKQINFNGSEPIFDAGSILNIITSIPFERINVTNFKVFDCNTATSYTCMVQKNTSGSTPDQNSTNGILIFDTQNGKNISKYYVDMASRIATKMDVLIGQEKSTFDLMK